MRTYTTHKDMDLAMRNLNRIAKGMSVGKVRLNQRKRVELELSWLDSMTKERLI